MHLQLQLRHQRHQRWILVVAGHLSCYVSDRKLKVEYDRANTDVSKSNYFSCHRLQLLKSDVSSREKCQIKVVSSLIISENNNGKQKCLLTTCWTPINIILITFIVIDIIFINAVYETVMTKYCTCTTICPRFSN